VVGQEIVDLYMSLRLIAAPFVAGAAEATAAGERMALTINAATGEITLGMERMAAKTTAATEAISVDTNKLVSGNARLAASIGSASAEWETSYAAMAATTTELSIQMAAAEAKAGASAEAMAAKIDAAAASTTATTAGKIEALKKFALGAAVVAGVVAGESLNMAADFQTSTTRLQTSAGESAAGLAVVRKGILNMAGEVGVSADEMSKAMYMIESASYHGEAGLGVLKAAMEGSKAEGADAAKVANALTSALRDYYPHAEKAGEVTNAAALVMSKFVGATSAGKMTFDDLAGSLHTLLPAAMAAGVGMDDALAALASMTVHGVSAEQATQNLAHALGHLQTLTAPQAKEFALLGISAMKLKDNLSKKGLTGTVEDIGNAIQSHMDGAGHVVLHLMDALKGLPPEVQKLGQSMLDGSIDAGQFTKATKGLTVEQQGQAQGFATLAKSTHGLGKEQKDGTLVYQTYSEALKAAMGDQTGLNVALMIGKENIGYTKGALDTINAAMPDAAGHVKGFAEVQETFNQKMAQAKDGIGAMAIKIGTYLLPAFTAIAGVVAGVTGVLSHNDGAAKALAITIGVVLVAALAAGAVGLVGWVRNLSPMATAVAGTTAKLGLLAAGLTFGLSNMDTFAGKASLVVTGLMAISTVGPLVVGAVGKVREGIGNTRSALSTFGAGVGAAEGAVGKFGKIAGGVGSFLTGPWGIAIGLAVGALALFSNKSDDAHGAVDDLTKAISDDSNSLGDNARAWTSHKLETDGALANAKDLGISEKELTDALINQGPELDAIKTKLQAVVKAGADAGNIGDQVTGAIDPTTSMAGAQKLIDEINNVAGSLNASKEAAQRQSNALHKSAGELDTNAHSAMGTANTNGDLATATQKVTDAMDAEKNEAKLLTDRLDFLNGGNIDAARGALRFKDSVDGIAKAMKENGTVVDLNSEAGRKNLGVILDGAEAAKTHASAVATQTHSVEEGNKAFQGDVAALQNVMKHAGLTADQIKWLTDKYLQVPHDLDTKITVDTSAAMAALNSVKKAMSSVASWIPGMGHATGGLIGHYASGGVAHFGPGGPVSGLGTESSDSIPTMLSDDEYVQRARAVHKFGVPFMDVVNAGDADGAYRMLAGRPDVNRGQLGALAGGIKAHSGGGTTVINKYETHAGAVITDHDLQEIVQRVVLRYGQRNNGPGLTMGWNT
jgi:hypothetical protein